jgi:hypothetical protein
MIVEMEAGIHFLFVLLGMKIIGVKKYPPRGFRQGLGDTTLSAPGDSHHNV